MDSRRVPEGFGGTSRFVTVYLVTYRRHALLERAISSVVAQSHRRWRLLVVNDDPEDPVPGKLVERWADSRVSLLEPLQRRGGAGNFNLAFTETEGSYATILEDDNWWEPHFLERQVEALERNPEHDLVIGNERVWRENRDGSWTDTKTTIWPFRELRTFQFSLASLCGSAQFRNSSFLVRVLRKRPLITPNSIPVDVTEHFRDRTLPRDILLNGEVLVNFSETLSTARGGGALWGRYQRMLIGSVFQALSDSASRTRLAHRLWEECPDPLAPRATTLVMTGLFTRDARALLRRAPATAVGRTALAMLRRPKPQLFGCSGGGELAERRFLINSELTRVLATDWERGAECP